METLGSRIAQRRKELHLTQEELANRLGYASRVSVNKIEKDVHTPSLDLIARFANALDCDPAYLALWQDEPRREDTLRRLSAYLDKMEKLNADKMQ